MNTTTRNYKIFDHEKKIVLATGRNQHAYAALLIATGTRPRIPAIPGLDPSRVQRTHLKILNI